MPEPMTEQELERIFYHAGLHRWTCYGDAVALIAEVRRLRELHADSMDTNRLDWLDKSNAAMNDRNGTVYGWKLDWNHNRIALTDSNWPAKTIREAIDKAMGTKA